MNILLHIKSLFQFSRLISHRLIEITLLIMPFSAFPNDAKSHAPYQNRLNKDSFVARLAQENSPKPKPKAEANGKVKKEESAEPPEDKIYSDYLQNNGYLDTPLLSDPNIHLDNPIHPIFDISNFDNTHESTALAHSHMTPALRLASIWLTKPEFLPWFVHVQLADEIADDKATGKSVLSISRSLTDDDRLAALDQVKARFIKMAQEVKFYWRPAGRTKKDVPMSCCGLNDWDALATIRESKVPKGKGKEFSPVIGINTHRLYHLVSPNGATARSSAENLRFQLRFAIDLVHELAHVFWMYKVCDGFEVFKGGRWEPYVFARDFTPELGHSWERAMFKCYITNNSTGFKPIGVIVMSEWDLTFSSMSACAVLPMALVEAFFMKPTWFLSAPQGSSSLDMIYVHYGLTDIEKTLFCITRFAKHAQPAKSSKTGDLFFWRRDLYLNGKRVAKSPDQTPVDGILNTATVLPKIAFLDWARKIFAADKDFAIKSGFIASQFHSARYNYKDFFYDGEKGSQDGVDKDYEVCDLIYGTPLDDHS